jgi:hypothetical protein
MNKQEKIIASVLGMGLVTVFILIVGMLISVAKDVEKRANKPYAIKVNNEIVHRNSKIDIDHRGSILTVYDGDKKYIYSQNWSVESEPIDGE